jgi:hypothetical protein
MLIVRPGNAVQTYCINHSPFIDLVLKPLKPIGRETALAQLEFEFRSVLALKLDLVRGTGGPG